MTKPAKSKTGARIRASELYRAAANKRGAYSESSRLLALEGYGSIAVNTLRIWALRDGWREPRMNEKAVKKYHAVITERLLNSEQPVRSIDPRHWRPSSSRRPMRPRRLQASFWPRPPKSWSRNRATWP